MDRSQLLFLTITTAIMNGIFSPLTAGVMILWPVWYPALILPTSLPFILFFSSLIVSTTTLLLAGIPAAFVERVMRLETSTAASVGVWLGGTILLSIPALRRVIDFL